MTRTLRGARGVRTGLAIGACALLLILFAALSYSAARKQSATYDEPLHSVAGYVQRTLLDFRINPEDPALFGYWASIPHASGSLKLDRDLRYWDAMLDDSAANKWFFLWLTLYRTPENDASAFINASRRMFVIVGTLLGALIAWWSWRLGGATAAVVATAFFALDPNFMAHAGLVKNDVMLSLLWAALAFALWSFGRRGNWPSLAAIVLCCAAAVNVKFSGVLAGPLIFATLLVRTLLPQDWVVLGRALKTRKARLLTALPLVCATVAVVSYLAIWACYGFRFAPTSDPGVLLNDQPAVATARANHLRARLAPGEMPTQRMWEEQGPGVPAEAILWAESRRLLPQPWLHGLLYTYGTSLYRGTFLMGEVRATGWWYYFPCAMLFKTPTATLLAMLVAAAFLASQARKSVDWWSIACLTLPVLSYGASAISTNLNLGLRHILPVYPFVFAALGVALSLLIGRWRRLGSLATSLLLLALAAESLPAYPHFLPFFNTPSGGARGGLRLLGDSNLDWGQDLPLLAEWQKRHRDRPLYLSYFGIADPAYYGIEATHLPPRANSWRFASAHGLPTGPCYLAVSATSLQGIYTDSHWRSEFLALQQRQPVAVLGGSIYVYELPPSLLDAPPVKQSPTGP